MIPYARQDIQQSDIDAVEQVLRSDFLTQVPVVPWFEATVANRAGAGFAVAVNSATSVLYIACLALDLGLGTLQWTSPVTFVASANCIAVLRSILSILIRVVLISVLLCLRQNWLRRLRRGGFRTC